MHTHHWLMAAVVTSQLCLASASHAQSAPMQAVIATKVLEPATPLVRKGLDLRPPKITDLFSQATIDRALSGTRDPRTIEEVEVEGRRSPSVPSDLPNIPGGILAPFWALANPTQSWRILLPTRGQPDSGPPPSATDPYRPPVLPPR